MINELQKFTPLNLAVKYNNIKNAAILLFNYACLNEALTLNYY